MRRYLADYRDCAVRKLPGQHDQPYVLVALTRDREEGGRTADEVQLSAPTLEALIDALLGEATDLGRDLAISELFEDESAGFDLNGLSLGMLATATHLAPGVPIPRMLLYTVNATIQPLASYNDAAETDETAQATNTGAPLALRLFTYPSLRLAEADGDHIGIRQAEYLHALGEVARGETEQAIQRLYRIIGWCQDHAADHDDLLMIVDFLLVAFIELARLELRADGVERAF